MKVERSAGGWIWLETCPRCKGTRHEPLTPYPCEMCRGSGVVPVDPVGQIERLIEAVQDVARALRERGQQ